MKKIVILISGRGSNMQALVDYFKEHAQARVVAVLSDQACSGINWAKNHGVATLIVPRQNFATRADFDHALLSALLHYQPDIIALAGFMRILGASLLQDLCGQHIPVLNIHPSLLPSFVGLHTHQRALDAGVKWHGATVHFVIPELDAGPIIAQGITPVLPYMDAHTLAAQVLKLEHIIYPKVVEWWANDALQINGQMVEHKHGLPQYFYA